MKKYIRDLRGHIEVPEGYNKIEGFMSAGEPPEYDYRFGRVENNLDTGNVDISKLSPEDLQRSVDTRRRWKSSADKLGKQLPPWELRDKSKYEAELKRRRRNKMKQTIEDISNDNSKFKTPMGWNMPEVFTQIRENSNKQNEDTELSDKEYKDIRQKRIDHLKENWGETDEMKRQKKKKEEKGN